MTLFGMLILMSLDVVVDSECTGKVAAGVWLDGVSHGSSATYDELSWPALKLLFSTILSLSCYFEQKSNFKTFQKKGKIL